jgi:hypothetical protein
MLFGVSLVGNRVMPQKKVVMEMAVDSGGLCDLKNGRRQGCLLILTTDTENGRLVRLALTSSWSLKLPAELQDD